MSTPENPEKVTKKEVMDEETKTDDGKKGDLKLALKTTCEFDQLSFKEEYKQLLFMASIKAPFFRADDRAPIDLICIVDESGSMAGERIVLVKQTVEFIIKNLESNDRFGCVGYSSSARARLELTKMDSTGKDKALKAVQQIHADGGTALCAGLLLGLKMMRDRTTSNNVSSLMLFTDGAANEGYTSANDIIRATIDEEFAKKDGSSYNIFANTNVMNMNTNMNTNMMNNINVMSNINTYQQAPQYQQLPQLQQMQQIPQYQQLPQQLQQQQQPGSMIGEANVTMEEKEDKSKTKTDEGAKNELPCTINTFGFGEGHNESLLQAIADHGRGMYAFIKTPEMISDTFAECLGGLVSVVAQNITLQVETLNDAKIIKIVSSGLNTKVVSPNQCYEVKFPDIQSEENRDVVFHLAVPKLKEEKKDWPLAKIVCSYKNAILDGKEEQVSTIASIARVDSNELGERNYELDLQNNRLMAADAMTEADQLANAGKLEEARKRLNVAQEQIEKSRSKKDKYSTGLITDIQNCATGLKNETEYQSHGGKSLKMNANAHNQQRAVQSSAYVSQEMYSNVSKVAMKKKFQPK